MNDFIFFVRIQLIHGEGGRFAIRVRQYGHLRVRFCHNKLMHEEHKTCPHVNCV
jgi:hypothetical protein